jgi:hypothetical protein
MAPSYTSQNRIIPPDFNLGDFELNLIDLDPGINSKKIISGTEPKLLEEKKQIRIALLRQRVNRTLTSVSKNSSTAFNQLVNKRILI